MRNFLLDCAVDRVLVSTVAGTTDVPTTGVDMLGFEEVTFVVLLGALTAAQATKIKVQVSDDNAAWADLSGTTSASPLDADGNKMLGVSVYRPLKRYVRLMVDRETANAVLDGVLAIRTALQTPVAQGATWALAPKRFSSQGTGVS